MSAMTSERTAVLLACLLLPACSMQMALPKDFLQVERHFASSEFKAVTADDARVWVREFDDADRGGLEFWLVTLKTDCTDRRGYQFVGEGECKDGDGHAGKWLEFRGVVAGEKQGYLIAVFLRATGWFGNGQSVRTVEFAAREDQFLARQRAVLDALPTVHR